MRQPDFAKAQTLRENPEFQDGSIFEKIRDLALCPHSAQSVRMKRKPFLILHVEDEPAHAEIVQRALASFACQIQHVEDGQQALDYLYHLRDYHDPATSLRPNLVILDLNLPKISGFDILRAIKTDPDLMSIPTVVLSTSSASVDLREAYSRHANGYTLKTGNFEKQKTILNALALYWSEYNCAAV